MNSIITAGMTDPHNHLVLAKSRTQTR